MRCTQFIGLTATAEAFVEDLEHLPSDTETGGMFEDEVIELRRWKMPVPLDDDRTVRRCIREKVQMVPWSSGPMIFTCLEIDWGHHRDFPEDEENPYRSECFQWIMDPTLGKEFCQLRETEKWNEMYPGEECRVTVIGGDEYDKERGAMWV